MTFLEPLHRAGFRRLLAGLVVSQLGDWSYNVALLAVVFERTHSTAWVGATTAVRVLPVVLLGPVAGVLGDRFDRRTVMVGCDLIRAAVMLALVAGARAGEPVIFVPLLAALAAAASSPYPSCVAATVPRMVPHAELPAANALRSAIAPLSIVAGPALGTGLLAAGGAGWAFGVNAVTFLVSAAFTLAVPGRDVFRPTGSQTRSGLWADVQCGARELGRHRDALRLVGADVLCSLVYGVQTVALVAVALHLGWDAGGCGVLLAAIGVGGLVGTACVTRAVRRLGRRPVQVLALGAVAGSLPLLAVLPSSALVLLAALVSGAGALAVEVCTETALAEQLDDEVFARAYGLAFPVSIAGIAVGSLVAGPLLAAVGLSGALLLVAVVVAVYTLGLAVVHDVVAVA